jgi:cytoplasmic iron level regulating protein YaaA (DUF328/UPF0246 family)
MVCVDVEHGHHFLFIITCSASKCQNSELDRRWLDITADNRYSRFQEFTPLRKELANFYSKIENLEYAKKVYTGYKSQQPDRAKKAWHTNMVLPTSSACRAIYRYTGSLYQELDRPVKDLLAEGVIPNVLIISALHGPTLPNDYLPDYNLTMEDYYKPPSQREKRLLQLWPHWIREYAGETFKAYLEQFDALHIMAGKNYRDTAQAVRDLMPSLKHCYESPSCKSQSNRQWGKELNHVLPNMRRP